MKKKILKITSIILITLLVLLSLLYIITISVYNNFFDVRFTSSSTLKHNLEDFNNLKRTKYEFKSNNDQTLVGYNYYVENTIPYGLIVMSHGYGGGGHENYLDVINYFVNNNYIVFAFDVTGNDESEGDSINGLPQGVIDFDYALRFIKTKEEFKDLPIMLFGHSWGAYSATNVLNYHNDIKAVVSISGFNESSDMLKSYGEKMLGGLVNIALPIIKTHEKIKFKEYASSTSMNGFKNTNTNVMVIHSKDDEVVAKKYGYDIYQKEYSSSNRFKFIEYENKGHNTIYYSEDGINYYNEIIKSNKKEIDREKWSNLIDKDLFNEIINFYNSSL